MFAKNTIKTRQKHVTNTKRAGRKQLRFRARTGAPGKTSPKGVVIMPDLI